MLKTFYICMIVMCLLILSPAFALTVEQSGNSVNLKVEYDEPTTNLDLSPLTDLKDTHVTYDKGAGEVECARVLATLATGGQHVVTTCNVLADRGEEFDVTVRAYATDLVGNVSDPSDPVSKHIDLNPPGKVK